MKMRIEKMKLPGVWVLSAFLLAAAYSQASSQNGSPTQSPTPVASDRDSKKINITRSGSISSGQGPAEYFTGAVRIETLINPNEPSRLSGARVTFEPGARTAWHSHPLGQTLIVTSGTGWVQQWNGQIQEIREGDVVWTPPGVKHWHGATQASSMTHIALQELLGGKNVQWMEKVSDEQYLAKPALTLSRP